MVESNTVEIGVELLSNIATDELSLSKTVDRLETLTSDPATTRAILDTAVVRGVIDREDGVVHVQRGMASGTAHEIVSREGEFTCQRCGASLSTGHFLQLDAGEHGPFGPTCVRKHLSTGRSPASQ